VWSEKKKKKIDAEAGDGEEKEDEEHLELVQCDVKGDVAVPVSEET